MRFCALIACVLLFMCPSCREIAPGGGDAKALGGGRVEGTIATRVIQLADQTRQELLRQKRVLIRYSADADSGHVAAYTRERQRIEVDITRSGAGSQVVIVTGGANGDQVSMDLFRTLQGD